MATTPPSPGEFSGQKPDRNSASNTRCTPIRWHARPRYASTQAEHVCLESIVSAHLQEASNVVPLPLAPLQRLGMWMESLPRDLTAAETLAFFSIASFAGPDGRGFAGTKRLAARANLPPSTFWRALAKLVERGLVIQTGWEKHASGVRTKTRRIATELLMMPAQTGGNRPGPSRNPVVGKACTLTSERELSLTSESTRTLTSERQTAEDNGSNNGSKKDSPPNEPKRDHPPAATSSLDLFGENVVQSVKPKTDRNARQAENATPGGTESTEPTPSSVPTQMGAAPLGAPTRKSDDRLQTAPTQKTPSSPETDEQTRAEFAAFWQAVPKNPNSVKKASLTSYRKARSRGATADEITAGIARYEWGANPQYWPHVTTWLNQDRFRCEGKPDLSLDAWGLEAWLATLQPVEGISALSYEVATLQSVMMETGLDATWRGDLAPLDAWLRAGYAPDSIGAVIADVVRKGGVRQTLKGFDWWVRDRVAAMGTI